MNNKTLNRMMRLFYLMGSFVFFLTAHAAANQTYHFKLTKGKGVPVCHAYLKRLNTTEFDSPPFCGIPENDSVEGFTLLKRVTLLPADVHDLYPIVWDFMTLANRKSMTWTDMNLQQQISQNGQGRLTGTAAEYLQRELDGGIAKIWRYAPSIDIDNDGVPDNVEVWSGSALVTGVGGGVCGGDAYPTGPEGLLLHQPQAAFLVTGNNDRLDVAKTEKIFGHPLGGYPLYDRKKGVRKMSEDFRPVGLNISIFKYESIYYIDTFFNEWGDFEGKRRKDKNIANTLGVFLHKDGKTKQVCEYQMTDKTQSVKDK